MGRHRLIRAEAAGQPVSVVLPEGVALETGQTNLAFAPGKVNVYADDWRIIGGAA